MTFEEIQQTIQGMLAVQKDLQTSQLRFAESLAELRESTMELNEVSKRHERRIEQLIGYSITGERDRMDIIQRLQDLERRVSRLEREER